MSTNLRKQRRLKRLICEGRRAPELEDQVGSLLDESEHLTRGLVDAERTIAELRIRDRALEQQLISARASLKIVRDALAGAGQEISNLHVMTVERDRRIVELSREDKDAVKLRRRLQDRNSKLERTRIELARLKREASW